MCESTPERNGFYDILQLKVLLITIFFFLDRHLIIEKVREKKNEITNVTFTFVEKERKKERNI